MKLKFCGIRRPEDVAYVNEVKPDFAGFIIEVPGRRRSLTAEQVKVLVKGLDKEILSVGVFVNAAPELPISLLRDGTLWAAQLHGDEDEDYIEKIQNMTGKPVIKAFSIKTPEDVQRALRSPADYILLDQGAGGTGEPFDWTLVPPVRQAAGQLLAGAFPPFHTHGDHQTAVGQLGPDSVGLLGEGRLDLGGGGIFRQPFLRQLDDL